MPAQKQVYHDAKDLPLNVTEPFIVPAKEQMYYNAEDPLNVKEPLFVTAEKQIYKDVNPARDAGDIYKFKVLLAYNVPVKKQLYNKTNPAGNAGNNYHTLHEFKAFAYYSKWEEKVYTTTTALVLRPVTLTRTSRYKNVCPWDRHKSMMKAALFRLMIVMKMALFWLM